MFHCQTKMGSAVGKFGLVACMLFSFWAYSVSVASE
jgi:hypothetical protein